MNFLRSLALLALVGLSACAAPEIPFDRSSAGEINSIGIITPHFPSSANVVLASSVGQSFGLIGALVDAGMESSRESKFKLLLEQQNFSAEQILLDKLQAGLIARGYKVTMIPYKHDQAEFATRYPTETEPKVDAYLDLVTLGYGYIAAGIGSNTPYRPQVGIRARLVRARDSAVLMQDAIIYNQVGNQAGSFSGKSVTIAPDPSYQFKDFDALIGQPESEVNGLRLALNQSAETVGQLLQ
jgi:hypothetical protein